MPRIRDRAICLRLIDWSETSQIVAVFSREQGLFRGVAKGARRFSPSSIGRFSGGLELLQTGQITANLKQGTDLAGIVEWDLQKPRPWFRRSLQLHRLGMFAAELSLAFFPEQQPHPPGFDALDEALDGLDSVSRAASALATLEWALCREAGVSPNVLWSADDEAAGVDRYWLDGSAGTVSPKTPDKPASGRNREGVGSVSLRASSARGAVTDGPGGVDLRGPWPMRPGTARVLSLLAEGGTVPDDAAGISAADVGRAAKLLAVYLQSVAERSLAMLPAVIELLDQKIAAEAGTSPPTR